MGGLLAFRIKARRSSTDYLGTKASLPQNKNGGTCRDFCLMMGKSFFYTETRYILAILQGRFAFVGSPRGKQGFGLCIWFSTVKIGVARSVFLSFNFSAFSYFCGVGGRLVSHVFSNSTVLTDWILSMKRSNGDDTTLTRTWPLVFFMHTEWIEVLHVTDLGTFREGSLGACVFLFPMFFFLRQEADIIKATHPRI